MTTPEKTEIPLGSRELQPNVSTYIAQGLVEHGMKIAFGVSGGHIWQMVDEMSNAGIKIITVKHEQSGVYAAEAYSKVTRRPCVSFGTVGPGVGNAVSAVQQCHESNSPVLFLGGGNGPETDYLPCIQPSYVLDLMRHITKFCMRCTEPAQVKQDIARAFVAMQRYPKGPAALEMPMLSLLKRVPPLAPPVSLYGEHALYMPKWRGDETGEPLSPGGDPAMIARAVKLLWEAKKPIIYAGDGVHWSAADKALKDFAELAQIPVTTRRIARGAFPEDNPLYLDSRSGRDAIRAGDIRLSLGMKVGNFDDWGQGWPPTIQVNESDEQIWTYIQTPCAIVGDVRIVLEQMIEYIKANNLKPPAERAEWVKYCEDIQKGGLDARRAKAEKYKDHTPIHYGYLGKVAWDVCEELYGGMNRVMIDGYTISDYTPAFIQARYSGQIMDASEYAGVGHGVGMAIGCCFADPTCIKHPVLALMGDAGMGIAGMDFETALIHKLPIVFLVTENAGWLTGMKYAVYGKNWEAMGPQDQPQGQEGVLGARYDKITEIFGGHGEDVSKPAEIKEALIRAFRSAEKGVPAIVNVHVDPRVHNRQLIAPSYVSAWAHIPWDKLAPRSKAARRVIFGGMFPFDQLGVPKMRYPDPWEPVADDEDFTIKE
ncbi:MAG: thiamine pyrophosphate-binding protein [Deltaproteobacteria bacterium]|nr:thiamine pyrophosphate-binding protein [Deltaproteobacteria bacterium]